MDILLMQETSVIIQYGVGRKHSTAYVGSVVVLKHMPVHKVRFYLYVKDYNYLLYHYGNSSFTFIDLFCK